MTSDTFTLQTRQFEVRFQSLFQQGRGMAFPCDASGRVKLDEQIGVARYVIESSPREAEFAIVLSDQWQGRGLGHELVSSLLVIAKGAGLGRLVGTTLSANSGMLKLGRRLGFRLSRVPGAAIITLLTADLDRL